MLRALGLAFLLSVSARAESPTNVFVNGGSTTTGNFSDQEVDAAAFYFSLFKEKATVLNAGDRPELRVRGSVVSPAARTKVVQMGKEFAIERTDEGRIKFSPSSLDMPTRPAILSEVRRVFADWEKEKPKAVTIGYGDHGGPEGVSLWNSTLLTPTETAKLHGKLPEETWVRSIHSHCYSGAALADPKRKKPKNLDDWKTFLSDNYRSHSCGLALSSESELAVAISDEKSWKDSPWTGHFESMRRDKKLSLSELKTRLSADKKVPSHVRLTSDYLTQDLFEFLCEKKYFEAADTPKPDAGHHGTAPAGGHPIDAKSPCIDTPKKKEADKLAAEVAEETALTLEILALRKQVAHSTLERAPSEAAAKEHAEWYEHYKKRQSTLDAARALMLTRDKLTPKAESELESAMHGAHQELAKFDALVLEVEEGFTLKEDFDEIWKSASFRKWFESKEIKDVYPLLRARWDDPAQAGMRKKTVNEIYETHAEEATAKKKKAKKAGTELDESRRRMVESALARTDFAEIKKVYDQIKECERTALE